jgi:hypothetical protein
MRTIKTYSNRAPFYNALIRHVAGSRIANLLYVAQKEELEGDRSTAREPSRLDLPLYCDESLTTSTGAVGAKTCAI